MTNLDQFEDTRGFIKDLKSHACSSALLVFDFWLLLCQITVTWLIPAPIFTTTCRDDKEKPTSVFSAP